MVRWHLAAALGLEAPVTKQNGLELKFYDSCIFKERLSDEYV